MKKDVGMTTVRKQEGWKWDQSLFCISSQQSLHILHYNLKLPDDTCKAPIFFPKEFATAAIAILFQDLHLQENDIQNCVPTSS